LREEQSRDRDSVWARIATEHPEFTKAMDVTNNYHMVREIVLGDSRTWAPANKLFKPAPGKRVMDVGANVGIYTAFCAANGALVTAYECDPSTYRVLETVVRQFPKVEARCVAIYTRSGTVRFESHTVPDEGSEIIWHNGRASCPGVHDLPGTIEFIEVPCLSFDEALGDKIWDCIKMDIEGGEAEILMSVSEEKLKQVKFMYVELHPWTPQELHDQVIQRMDRLFLMTGYWSQDLKRYEALYLEAK
jgi:FkbM family methyltransferase